MLSRLSGIPIDQLPSAPFIKTDDQEPIVQCDNGCESYCSVQCKYNASSRYHGVLCGHQRSVQSLLNVWKSFHYPPETASIELVIKMVGLITQEYATTKSQNLQSALDPWMRFESGGDSFRITTFVDSEDNEQQLYLSYVDLVSNVCNQYEELKNVLLQPQWFRRLFAVMALNSQGVGTSALEQHQQDLTQLLQQQNNCVTEQQKHQIEDYFQQLEVIDPLIEEVSGEFTRVEGSGLYLMHSKLNHSCVPNAQVLFTENNSNLRVVALRDIAAGEEICISYIDDCCSEEDSDDQQDVNGDDDMATEMDHDYEDVDGEQEDSEDGEPATTRRDRLEMYYNFVCNCEKCIREFSQHE